MDWERFNELVAQSESGRQDEAIEGLRKLVTRSESGEDNASVLLIIGACEKELGRYDEASRTLREARSLADKDSWINPRAIFFDASIDILRGNWKGGLTKLDNIVRDFSPMLNLSESEDLLEEVRRKRGMSLYELGRPAEALPLLKQAVAVEYEKETALYYLGRCYYDLGDLAESVKVLVEALMLDLHPIYQPSSHYVLGLAYRWQGQNARAISEFEWCLEHDNQALVAKWKILTGLLEASEALGLSKDAERYSRMLKATERTHDAK